MNLEHVHAAKDRIDQIERRINSLTRRFGPLSGGAAASGGFQVALARASSSVTAGLCPAEIEPLIGEAAKKYEVDPALIKGVIQAESGFRPNAVSSVGAQGLMQLMPSTSQALGVDPFDPAENIDGGTHYLRQLLDRFGSTEKALAAYNAGPGAVLRYGGVPPYSETQRYVGNVMALRDKYSGE